MQPCFASTLPVAHRARVAAPVFAGAAQPRKGLDVLLDAHASQPDLAPLVLAGPAGWGPGPTLSSRVRIVGYLNDADLRCVVAGAIAVVLPPRDEGFGLPVLEAMAAGVRVVCSDLPALPEIAGGVANLVPPDDPAALARARATADSGDGDRDGVAARRAHAARYTWRACSEATVAAYRQALD